MRRRARRWFLRALLGLLGLGPVPATAAEPCTKAAALEAGQPATCSGILWPESWSADAIRCIRVDLPRARADAVRAITVCEADRQAAEARAQTWAELAEKRRLELEAAARATIVVPRPWWQSPWVLGPAAFVLGGLAGVGVGHLAK